MSFLAGDHHGCPAKKLYCRAMMPIFKQIFITAAVLCLAGCRSGDTSVATPPMGWNSWISYGTSVTEDEVRDVADYMSDNLLEYGWQYVVVDAGWYAPGMVTLEQYEGSHPYQLVDKWGRLIVDPQKFPSAEGGTGFRALSDYVHSKGLKLGLHIMRGVPIQAYEQDCPIKGTPYTIRDIADTVNVCDWYFGFYGIDMSKPGAREYYKSLFDLYEQWGIDYVKADDLLSPSYAESDIEAISQAAYHRRHPIMLSLSPGPAPLSKAGHLRKVCALWRISEDFWDNWESLKKQFPLCASWQDSTGNGHWADADMLPIGLMALRAMRGEPRQSGFTQSEQRVMMTLWAFFRSPLMLGCSLSQIDPFTYSLITDRKLIEINQKSTGNRQLSREGDIVVWYASLENEDCYAVFNLGEETAEYDLDGIDRVAVGPHDVELVFRRK